MKKLLLLLTSILAPVFSAQAGNIITYTSSDGKVVEPHKQWNFEAEIVSNTYEDGQGKIVFDGDVTIIGNKAFQECRRLTSIAIPNSVTEISYWAFAYCDGLTTIDIPNSVTELQECPFSFCNNLEKFTGKFASADNRCLIQDGRLAAFARAGLTSYNIPSYVTSIGAEVFYEFKELTSVEIPSGVTNISETAFCGCSGLTSIDLPKSLKTIGSMAFGLCNGLTSVIIPNSVESIKFGGFRRCENLKSVVIGSSVSEIRDYGFSCSNLSEIVSLNMTPPEIRSNTFEEVDKQTCVLKVPEEALEAYKSAPYWCEFFNINTYDPAGIEGVAMDAAAGHEARPYNLQGQPVDENYRGIVIKDGKKVMRK